MRRIRTAIVGSLLVGSLASSADAAKDDDYSGTPIAVSGRSSVTYYDREGRMQTTTTIPGGSAMKRGGSNDRCSFVAAVDGITADNTPYRAGDTVTSTRWVYTERNQPPGTEAPGPGAVIVGTSGPVPRHLLTIYCDTNHFHGTTWVAMNDPSGTQVLADTLDEDGGDMSRGDDTGVWRSLGVLMNLCRGASKQARSPVRIAGDQARLRSEHSSTGDRHGQLPGWRGGPEAADVGGHGHTDRFDHVTERAARRADRAEHRVEGVRGDRGVDPDRLAVGPGPLQPAPHGRGR